MTHKFRLTNSTKLPRRQHQAGIPRCPPARPKKDLTSRRAGSVQTHIEVHSPPDLPNSTIWKEELHVRMSNFTAVPNLHPCAIAFNSRVNIKALVGIVKPSNLSCGIVVENKPCGIRAGPYLHWVAIRQPTNIKTQLGIRCHMYLPNPAPFFSCSCLCGSISEANRTWSYCSCINSSWSRPDQACSGWLELNAFTAG